MAGKRGSRAQEILQALARMLEASRGGRITTAALAAEVGIFREETIARVHAIDVVVEADIDYGVDVEVRTDGRLGEGELEGLVGFVAVLREAVFIAVDPTRGEVELRAGPHNAGRNLAPVGRENFFEVPGVAAAATAAAAAGGEEKGRGTPRRVGSESGR